MDFLVNDREERNDLTKNISTKGLESGGCYILSFLSQECTQDILSALHINSDIVIKNLLSLKDKARKLVCDWLHQSCRTNLSASLVSNAAPCQEEELRHAFLIGAALLRTECKEPKWHLLYVDILIAKGESRGRGL